MLLNTRFSASARKGIPLAVFDNSPRDNRATLRFNHCALGLQSIRIDKFFNGHYFDLLADRIAFLRGTDNNQAV